MNMTVAELAKAVKKPETYVRQHVRRGHIKTVKAGGNLFVTPEEVTRWAAERGFVIDAPSRPTYTVDRAVDRVARVTVLAWHPRDGQPVNLFTHIRHRRKDALGPWAKKPNETWSNQGFSTAEDDQSGTIQLHTLDTPLQQCEQLIASILDKREIEIAGQTIQYALEEIPRRHWAYRDERGQTEPSFVSPFSEHSAEVIEYWSLAGEPRELWLGLVASHQYDLQSPLAKLKFPLDRLSDRVGNFVISGALDWVRCDLSARRNGSLVLTFDADLIPGEYTAEIWACHSGDDVLRRTIPINEIETVIDLRSDVDRIGFALFRNSDGLCVDLMDVHLMMRISIAMNLETGPTVQLRNRKNSSITTLSPYSHRSMMTIEADKDSFDLDQAIRREVLDRRARERETEARREQNLARFGPGEFDAAVEYFIDLLSRNTYAEEPIYLADRYFIDPKIGADVRALYLRIFAETNGRPLRILCTQQTPPTWWSGPFSDLAKGVEVKACLAPSNTPAFHDRYLVTHEKEILISNSFNNWNGHGVTLASLPYEVYRSEAVSLWESGISVIGG